MAAIGAPRSTPDYSALSVMNMSLGGLFSSRINLNLREEHGYTYGAGSQFVFRKAAGPFLVASGVRTDVTGPAVGEIFKEIRAHGRDADGRRGTDAGPGLARSARCRRSSRRAPGWSAASRASTCMIWVSTTSRSIRTGFAAVTAADVQRVAQHYLVPGRMIVIAVGDRATIVPQLRKLGLGAIEFRDADGRTSTH